MVRVLSAWKLRVEIGPFKVHSQNASCPNLLPAAFTADNVESLLEAGARDYVNHPRGVDFIDEDFIVISSIYDWWVDDFGGTEAGVMEHLVRYADEDLAEQLRVFEGAVEYEYDWALTQP